MTDPVVTTMHYTLPVASTTDYLAGLDSIWILYEKAKAGQWNATTKLDWKTFVDPSRPSTPDEGEPMFYTPFWARMNPAEVERFRAHRTAWTLSQILHGEQGALMVAAQLTNAAPTMDSKLYAATQAMDEARHVEVFERYLREKIGITYQISPFLRAFLDEILGDPCWDRKFIGMQILVEGLALAAFHFLVAALKKGEGEPLLQELLTYVIQDESRHVGYGVLSLPRTIAGLSPAEFHERERFVARGTDLLQKRLIPEAVWKTMGWPVAELRATFQSSEGMARFRSGLFSKVVPLVKRVGLLRENGWLRNQFREMGILGFEDVDLQLGF